METTVKDMTRSNTIIEKLEKQDGNLSMTVKVGYTEI